MTTDLIRHYSLRPTVYNKGYIGIGEHKCCINGKLTKKYKVWYDMIMRCYSKKYLYKNPTYIGCEVDSRWLNYQVFADWFEDNYVEKYELDKDILVRGNKVYSPETCCFVPHSINALLINCITRKSNLPIGVRLTPGKRYKAELNIKGLRQYLGTFATSEEAFNVYIKAKKQEMIRQCTLYKNTLNINCYNALLNYDIKITEYEH